MIVLEQMHTHNLSSRLDKARKIEKMLLDVIEVEHDPGTLVCLDIGCSVGIIASYLANRFRHVIGIDPDAESIQIASQQNIQPNLIFIQGTGLALPFQDQTFDIIVCAQVYEHSTNPQWLGCEIRRVLKPGGCVFFSGPNKWWPIEYHYGWYFLHWLPRIFLNTYCRLVYGHAFDLVLYDYWQLKILWQDFKVYDYTLQWAYYPHQFLARTRKHFWARLVPQKVASIFSFLLPNFNWVLVKKNDPTNT